jgi:2-iminobutanoate/2-iminopropanoate deaminase
MRILPILLVVAACGCLARAPKLHLDAKNAVGPYSAAVESGETVWLSGKIGDPSKSFREEVQGAIDAIEADLKPVGLTLRDVVSVNVFLTDMLRFTEMNEVYAQRFPRPYPARTTVGVAALPKGARIEIQAVARR